MSNNQNIPQSRLIKVDRYNVVPADDGFYHLCAFNFKTGQYDDTPLKFSSREDAELHALRLNIDSKPLTLNLYIDKEKTSDNSSDSENTES